MSKRIATYLFVLALLLIGAFAITATADDYLYIREGTVSDTPKILPRLDNSLGDLPFRDNPALLELTCPYELFFDGYYIGSSSKISTSGVMISNGSLIPPLPPAGAVLGTATSEGHYYSNSGGTDLGFALKLGSRSNLAFIFNYLYADTHGQADIANQLLFAVQIRLGFFGTQDDRFESNRYAPMLLFSTRPSDALSLGAGLGYAYITDDLSAEVRGNTISRRGVINGFVESEESLKLKYHRFSPVVGVSFTPSDRVRLDASLGADFSFGSVLKDSFIDDNGVYTEDLDSHDLLGWGIHGAVEPTVTLSESLALPIVVSGSYERFRWEVDGLGYGFIFPGEYWGVFQGGGPIDYENDSRNWDVSAGVGLRLGTAGMTLTVMPIYTHCEFDNDFTQVNDAALFPPGLTLTILTQDDREVRDVASLDVTLKKAFSDSLSAELGLRYDFGWARRDYDIFYSSAWESFFLISFLVSSLDGSNSATDTFQDLTLSTKLTYRPAERLSLSFSGLVKIPLDPADFHMPGTVAGISPNDTTFRFRTSGINREYEDSTWIYGGLLTLTYEFGCPVAVPPPALPRP